MRMIADRSLLADNIRFLRGRRKLSRGSFAKEINVPVLQVFCIEQELIDYIELQGVQNISKIYGIEEKEILWENLRIKYQNRRFPYRRLQ